MGNFRVIWRHEVRQAHQISRYLIETEKLKFGWRILVLPVFIFDYVRYRKSLRTIRKNLMFTKKLAFNAAKNIFQGKERVREIRQIEIKTKELLNKERKGLYTEKIRRKQSFEIESLINHYLDLLNTNSNSYQAMLRAKYPSKGNYLTFLNKIQKAEEEVIRAAITTMNRGTKKERRKWFEKVIATTKKVRMTEADAIYT